MVLLCVMCVVVCVCVWGVWCVCVVLVCLEYMLFEWFCCVLLFAYLPFGGDVCVRFANVVALLLWWRCRVCCFFVVVAIVGVVMLCV